MSKSHLIEHPVLSTSNHFQIFMAVRGGTRGGTSPILEYPLGASIPVIPQSHSISLTIIHIGSNPTLISDTLFRSPVSWSILKQNKLPVFSPAAKRC